MGRVVECGSGSGAKGPLDFTGYWTLSRHEGMDDFLRAAGFPWVVRKAALKFGGSAVDIIVHSGSLLRVTSLNAKGSWGREYDVDKEVMQRNAEGTMCKTTAWWEGRVFRSRMEGSELGVLESWRYMRGSSMAVRTALRPAHGGPEGVMFWYFERMETLQRHVAAHGGMRGGSLLHQIESDQRRVARATRKDTRYIQAVLLDWQRWKSPADDFIQVAAPLPASLSRHSRARYRSPGSGSPRTLSPVSLSKSPSNDSLAALPPGVEVRSEARSVPSDSRGSRGRLAESELSSSALDRMARQAAALAMPPGESPVDSSASPPPGAAATAPLSGSRLAGPAAGAVAGTPPLPPAQQQQQQQSGVVPPAMPTRQASGGSREGAGPQAYEREPSLSYPGGVAVPVEAGGSTTASSPGGRPATGVGPPHPNESLTFRPPSASSPGGRVDGSEAASPSGPSAAPDSDAATRGSTVHHRTGSVGSLGGLGGSGGGGQRPVHYKSLSGESIGRGAASTPGRASPRSATPGVQPGLRPSEQLMALRLHEFVEARGIASVVPVATPNDTLEPQLLSMSPEQAEDTAAKLRELESDMLLRRQESRHGCNLCGCFVITLASDTLPEHLRVWEMTLI